MLTSQQKQKIQNEAYEPKGLAAASATRTEGGSAQACEDTRPKKAGRLDPSFSDQSRRMTWHALRNIVTQEVAQIEERTKAKQEASHADGGASMNLVVAATEVDFSSTENPLPKSPAKKEKAAGEGVAGYTMDRRAEEYGLQKR